MTRPSEAKDDPWHYDWEAARWVHLETKLKSRPAYIGFVDEDEGPNVYLLCPMILNREGKWIDSWTWRERIGPLPQLKSLDPAKFFGEVIVYKWTIKRIKRIRGDRPPMIKRCWTCGKRIPRGLFCEDAAHEAAFQKIGLDKEML